MACFEVVWPEAGANLCQCCDWWYEFCDCKGEDETDAGIYDDPIRED
jgi:hypothetical protein